MRWMMGIAVLLVLFANQLMASQLIESMLYGETQQSITDGKIAMCGVTIFGMEKSSSPRAISLHAFNGSITLGAGYGIVKGRAGKVDYSPSKAESDRFKLRAEKTDELWMKAANSNITSPFTNNKIERSEDAGYIFYKTRFDEPAAVLMAIIAKEPIQIFANRKRMKHPITLFGVVEMSDAQFKQLDNCISELFSTDEPSKEAQQ